jgi:hypothetical protein
LALLVAQPSARAETKPPTNSQACGTTIEENLAAARKALQSNNAETQAALVCLIEATSALNERLQAAGPGGQQSGMLHAPVSDVPVQPSRR